jgi:hypothetical protein
MFFFILFKICGRFYFHFEEVLTGDISLCTNGPGKKCLDLCISNSGTEPDCKKASILFIYLFFLHELGGNNNHFHNFHNFNVIPEKIKALVPVCS